MNRDVLRLKQLVEDGKVMFRSTFSVIPIDEALARRDLEPFEREWMRVYDDLARRLPDEPPIVQEIRENVYRSVYDLTENPDVAAYASDDFGLIATAAFLGYEDEWLNGLWVKYRSGAFPAGDVTPVSGKIAALIP
jgi:hypothetical protein